MGVTDGYFKLGASNRAIVDVRAEDSLRVRGAERLEVCQSQGERLLSGWGSAS
jgi:hypothetical protein